MTPEWTKSPLWHCKFLEGLVVRIKQAQQEEFITIRLEQKLGAGTSHWGCGTGWVLVLFHPYRTQLIDVTNLWLIDWTYGSAACDACGMLHLLINHQVRSLSSQHSSAFIPWSKVCRPNVLTHGMGLPCQSMLTDWYLDKFLDVFFLGSLVCWLIDTLTKFLMSFSGFLQAPTGRND